MKIYKFEDVAGPEKDAYVLPSFIQLDLRLIILVGTRSTYRTVYISFGGLLMALRGSYRHLSNIVVGENVYCLIRK